MCKLLHVMPQSWGENIEHRIEPISISWKNADSFGVVRSISQHISKTMKIDWS